MRITISVIAMEIAAVYVAINQIITNFRLMKLRSRCQELEKKVADLENQVQPFDGTWESMYQVMQPIKQALDWYVKEEERK